MADRHPTRQRLLQLIRERGGCTISELRRETGQSRSTLRQHLSVLIRSGLVHGHFRRRPTGRPPLLYRLTLKADLVAPETYAAFVWALFAGMRSQGREGIEATFAQVAERLAQSHPDIRRFPEAGDRLDAARRLFFGDAESRGAEATESRFQFSLRICPLAPVAMEFKDLCCITREVLTQFIGDDIQQSEWIVRGDPRCTFEVRTRESAQAKSA